MSIPRRYVLVWMGQLFPYACRLAVESIALADEGAVIEIYVYGDGPLGEHLAALQHLDAVDLRVTDVAHTFEPLSDGLALRILFDAIPAHAVSARSNLLRYALLYERGGVYVDFDVLVVRPLPDLCCPTRSMRMVATCWVGM